MVVSLVVTICYLCIWVARRMLTICTDYLNLTKRFGHVGISQLPLLYLLALKHPWNPLILAFPRIHSHATLNPYHRLLALPVIILCTLHVVFYLNFFFRNPAVLYRLVEIDIIWGYTAFIAFAAIGITALPQIRHRPGWYQKVFYRTHVILAAVTIIAVWYHVDHVQKYLLETGFLYLLNMALRWMKTCEQIEIPIRSGGEDEQLNARIISAATDSDLILLRVPRPKKWSEWKSGQFVYLYVNQYASEGKGMKFGTQLPWAAKSPFTIMNMCSTETGKTSTVDLAIRRLGGDVTGSLRRCLSSVRTVDGGIASLVVRLEGPYGTGISFASEKSSLSSLKIPGRNGGRKKNPSVDEDHEDEVELENLLTSDEEAEEEVKPEPSKTVKSRQDERCLLVSGGVGITYTLPIFFSLLREMHGKATHRVNKVKLLWFIRHRAEASVILDSLRDSLLASEAALMSGAAEIHIYITRADSSAAIPSVRGVTIHETTQARQILRDTVSTFCDAGVSVSQQRDAKALSKLHVIVCGPESLNSSVRTEAGALVHRRHDVDVRFHAEEFGF